MLLDLKGIHTCFSKVHLPNSFKSRSWLLFICFKQCNSSSLSFWHVNNFLTSNNTLSYLLQPNVYSIEAQSYSDLGLIIESSNFQEKQNLAILFTMVNMKFQMNASPFISQEPYIKRQYCLPGRFVWYDALISSNYSFCLPIPLLLTHPPTFSYVNLT